MNLWFRLHHLLLISYSVFRDWDADLEVVTAFEDILSVITIPHPVFIEHLVCQIPC